MSAECNKCGADLVYGEWPEMFCQVCRLRAEHASLRDNAGVCQQRIAGLEAENARLREALQRIREGTAEYAWGVAHTALKEFVP